MPLTELKIRSLKPKDKLYRVTDGNGLTLEIAPTGSKLWRWRYYFQGKPQMYSLGRYPDLTLAEARKKRDEARMLVRDGKHPTREKKANVLRRKTEGENTFEHVARYCLKVMQKDLSEKYATQNLTRLEQHVFPKIGHLPITEITIPDIVHVVEGISNRGTREIAKRAKQLIAQVFRFGTHRGICTHNPAADLRDILPSKEEKHFACIPQSELPQLLRAIEARQPDLTKMAMQLLSLTFVRTSELIGARWAEINWEKAEWHIPKERMKMKRPHIVPLSRQALIVLRQLQDRTGTKEYLFFSPASRSMHISNGTILMALRRMGYQGRMTGHGFRTLASTILNETGYQPDVIERQLAHEDEDKIRAAYNRAEYLPERKKMMQDYADILEAASRPTKEADANKNDRKMKKAA